jgi:hypothetical protein
MQVMVLVNGAHLAALLDSGSTHNFVDSAAAMRAGSRSRRNLGCTSRLPTVIVCPVRVTVVTSCNTLCYRNPN